MSFPRMRESRFQVFYDNVKRLLRTRVDLKRNFSSPSGSGFPPSREGQNQFTMSFPRMRESRFGLFYDNVKTSLRTCLELKRNFSSPSGSGFPPSREGQNQFTMSFPRMRESRFGYSIA